MDIVLNTLFNNPNLPITLRPGLVDGFGRSAGQISKTDDYKDWDNYNGTWVTNGDGTASGAGSLLADGLSPNGEVTLTVDSFDPEGTDFRCGVVFRAKDRHNHLRAALSTSGLLNLYVIVDEATSESFTTGGVYPQDGDTIGVRLNGENITLTLNGEVVLTHTTSMYMTETQYGLYSQSTNNARFDEIKFVAN